MKRALIFGVSGQDGAYLSRLLLEKGYAVHGTSRDAEAHSFENLARLGIRERITVHSVSLVDFRNVLQAITQAEPDEIYNLAGQTSVGLSFAQPVEAIESITLGTLQILEAIRYLKAPIRFYNASSSECFGEIAEGEAASESTPFLPRSPYATAKAAAHWAAANYRDAYGIFACSGILFNHESPLRPERFVTMKIVAAAKRIAAGSSEKLELGNLDIRRDWGYAPEYVDAMWRMLQQETPDDFVIATGEAHTLRDWVETVFGRLDLDWREHVVINPDLFRPSEILYSRGDASKARARLGWVPETDFGTLLDGLTGR
ncbi:MAG TPA: GDP-mannose 4,6-dehydratase [Thermoanaerobaculia bacterium]|nr:GDP-mannose 4,6-dehydratase [Thermoanaerobaculia bacterium]